LGTPIATRALSAPLAVGLKSNPPHGEATPFRDAAEAWFWTMRLIVRRSAFRSLGASVDQHRPCEPADVINALGTLIRRRRIDAVHTSVLRIWGQRQVAPCPRHDRADYATWRDAITQLEFSLRVRGIVA
jgi:hypothetical protein